MPLFPWICSRYKLEVQQYVCQRPHAASGRRKRPAAGSEPRSGWIFFSASDSLMYLAIFSPGHCRQPRLAYLSEASKRTGKRPLDPPPVIRLRTESADIDDDEGDGPEEPEEDAAFSRLTHNLFLFATLLPEDAQTKDDEVRQARNDLVNGTLFSSLSQFRGQSCFAFPDLNVLAEGRWRFCMSLYELSM